MKKVTVSYEHCLVENHTLQHIGEQLQPEIQQMNHAITQGYTDDRASINLADDSAMVQQVMSVVQGKHLLHPTHLIIVGIGGSNLGILALQEALLGKLYNLQDPSLKILYADTVDADPLYDIINIVKNVLQQGENVLINVISKSGGTTETIANFEVVLEVLKNHVENYQDFVVVTTDQGSKLWELAQSQGFTVLSIPKKVGGRFSVFSPVGLFPLAMLGIDIEELLSGVLMMREQCVQHDFMHNPAALRAAILFHHLQQNKSIHDLFLFSTDCESLGKWYRQLMGESIGKEYNTDDEQVFEGMTPTVSIGSTDLHSMAQMYLGGPYDKVTTFVQIQKNKHQIPIPTYPEYERLVSNIQGKQIQDVMEAILKGVQQAFVQGKRPFMTLTVPEKSPHVLGQLLQLFMMEIMYLGFLLNVNPFDQPNVEAYKTETKTILQQIKT